jgi:hydrogenase nickel incorporation protein HypB
VRTTASKTMVVESVLSANDATAQANRAQFDQSGTYAVNMMSSPGAGKTTLLERTLEHLAATLRVGVLEGDIQTSLDADRLARFQVPVVQINTDEGFGGACHLDADMVRFGLASLPVENLDLLLIENIGNLICPADFNVGEHHKVIVCSVAEGEDKPLKYPLMFRAADLLLVNKIDLLPHLEFDLPLLLRNIEAVNPRAPRILTSARTGEGIDAWCAWLADQRARRIVPA